MPISAWPTPLLRPALLVLALALPVACAFAADPPKAVDQPPAAAAPPPNPVIAKVNGTELHLSDLLFTFGQRARQLPYPQMLDRLIDVTLAADAGKAQHLDDDPEVKQHVALAQKQFIAQAYVDKLQQKAVSEEAIKARYDDMVAKKEIPEEVKARHILLNTEPEAKAVIAQLEKGADFAKLANEKTKDHPEQKTGGELGWFPKDKMVAEFSEAAFKLKPGEFTKVPVHTQFGYHVIQTEDRRVQPFEDAKQGIENELAQNSLESTFKGLEAKAQIERFGPDGKPMAAPAPDTAEAPPTGAAPAGKPATDAPKPKP